MIKLVDILKEDNHVITFDKKSDEKFYRKVLNYVVENLGTKIIKNIKSYIYCKESYCLPLVQTLSYKKIDGFLEEELQLKVVEKEEIYLLLLFNISVQDFLTEPLDLGEDYKLYHVHHTAPAIERDVEWSREDCQMCDGDSELKYECGYCNGEGTVNYQDYDTPQECQECRGDGHTMVKCEDCQDGTVEKEIIYYRLDYLVTSFLSKKELIIPSGVFSFDEFIELNKNNDIIKYKEMGNGYKLEHWKEDLEQPGLVQSVENVTYFDKDDLYLIRIKKGTRYE